MLPAPFSLPISLQPLLSQRFWELGKLPCPCPPRSAVSMGVKAAAGFEILVSLPHFGGTWVFISCPGIYPNSICPVPMAAHAPVSYLSAPCSQERAGGADVGWIRQGSLCKHQMKGSIYPVHLLGLLLPPTNAPPWHSDTYRNPGKNEPPRPGLGACKGCPILAGRLGYFTDRAGRQTNNKSRSVTADVALTETVESPGGVGEKRERREEGGRWHQQWPPALNLLLRSPLITSVEAMHALLGASKVFMG